MLELLGTMLQQNQEQGKSFMTAVQAMAVEQERQALGLREAVSNMSSKHASSPQLSKLLQRPDVFRPKIEKKNLPCGMSGHGLSSNGCWQWMQVYMITWKRLKGTWQFQ